MTDDELEVRPAGSGLVRRLRLGSPVARVAVLGLPLVAMTSVLTGSSDAATWVVPSSANAGDQAWLAGLVGPAPTTSPGEIPPPDLAVLPSGGDPQVLVLPGGGTSSDDGGRGAAAPSGGPDTGMLTGTGIPRRVLQAYVAAARQSARIDPSCHVPWSLLAGIGRVETDHGRFGGAHVLADGLVTPPIYGPRLNGTNGMPFLHDTDGGRLDADANADRAVGPMQFIPGTWAGYGTDADGDGVANPQDVDDAALSAARYLCAGGGDLATQDGRVQAVFRYNHSTSYVRLVLALADSYATGRAVPVGNEPVVPAPSSGGTSATGGGSPPAVNPEPLSAPGSPAAAPATSASTTATPTPSTSPKSSPSTSPTPSPSTSRSPSPTPSTSPTPTPSTSPTPTPSSPTPTSTPTPSTPPATSTPTPSTSSSSSTPTPSATTSSTPSTTSSPPSSPTTASSSTTPSESTSSASSSESSPSPSATP